MAKITIKKKNIPNPLTNLNYFRLLNNYIASQGAEIKSHSTEYNHKNKVGTYFFDIECYGKKKNFKRKKLLSKLENDVLLEEAHPENPQFI